MKMTANIALQGENQLRVGHFHAIQFGARGEDGARVGIRIGGEHTGIGAGGAKGAIGPEEFQPALPEADGYLPSFSLIDSCWLKLINGFDHRGGG